MANQEQIYVPAVSKKREGEFHKRVESWQALYQDVLARGQAQKAGKICNDICEWSEGKEMNEKLKRNFYSLSIPTFTGEICTAEDNIPLGGGSALADWYKSWKAEWLQIK